LSTRSIYIVDDDDAVRLSLQSALSTLPNTLIWTFRSGDAFLERLEELDPGCVLLDYHMPGANGLEVLRRLEEAEGRFAAIILTAHGGISLAVQGMREGAADFLEKPFEFEALIESVQLAFARLEHASGRRARAREAEAKLKLLSPRELEVLNALVEGLPNKVIAHKLQISPRTVEIHRAKMMERLGARSLSDVLKIAFAAGLFPNE
jgi:two-component system, LuxR family, response regulator FixJ